MAKEQKEKRKRDLAELFPPYLVGKMLIEEAKRVLGTAQEQMEPPPLQPAHEPTQVTLPPQGSAPPPQEPEQTPDAQGAPQNEAKPSFRKPHMPIEGAPGFFLPIDPGKTTIENALARIERQVALAQIRQQAGEWLDRQAEKAASLPELVQRVVADREAINLVPDRVRAEMTPEQREAAKARFMEAVRARTPADERFEELLRRDPELAAQIGTAFRAADLNREFIDLARNRAAEGDIKGALTAMAIAANVVQGGGSLTPEALGGKEQKKGAVEQAVKPEAIIERAAALATHHDTIAKEYMDLATKGDAQTVTAILMRDALAQQKGVKPASDPSQNRRLLLLLAREYKRLADQGKLGIKMYLLGSVAGRQDIAMKGMAIAFPFSSFDIPDTDAPGADSSPDSVASDVATLEKRLMEARKRAAAGGV